MEGELRKWVRKENGLRSTHWQLQNSLVVVSYSIENIVWYQVGTTLTAGSLHKFHKCLTTIWNT